ncbi:MAG: PorP/SprF family type IX secretion system membrane protein [Filimonas sp.]|nr:PorP/SprF family type IX secretion system membrane protein [Filimonas sp.]
MKKQLLNISLMVVLSTIAVHVEAQDPNFSQYFSSPLCVNPANTGFFYGSQRIVGNYRRQWWGAGEPFTTATISFDAKIPMGAEGNDKLGIGVMALNDKAAGGLMKSNYFSLSGAYHKALDDEGHTSLGLGFQASYVNKIVDLTNASFSNQFTSGGFDLSLPTGENYLAGSTAHFDVSTGLLFKHDDENKNYYFGVSYFHVTKPKESIINDNNTRVAPRLSAQAGFSTSIGENRIFLSAMFQNQAKVNMYALGGAFAYALPSNNNDVSWYIGGWYGNTNLYPYTGLQFNNFQFGITYDIITTQLKTASQKNGSFELSMNYIIFGHKGNSGDKPMAPQF